MLAYLGLTELVFLLIPAFVLFALPALIAVFYFRGKAEGGALAGYLILSFVLGWIGLAVSLIVCSTLRGRTTTAS